MFSVLCVCLPWHSYMGAGDMCPKLNGDRRKKWREKKHKRKGEGMANVNRRWYNNLLRPPPKTWRPVTPNDASPSSSFISGSTLRHYMFVSPITPTDSIMSPYISHLERIKQGRELEKQTCVSADPHSLNHPSPFSSSSKGPAWWLVRQ